MKGDNIRWAILTSGFGRNVMDCLDLQRAGVLGPNQFVCLVTHGQETMVQDIAREMGLVIREDSPKDYETVELYEKDLADFLKRHAIDFIFLLNYKYRIRLPLLEAFPNKILNIHPSLLPSFANTKTAIQDAMVYGVKMTGITTHIIDEQLDKGIILCQKARPIESEDTFDTLEEKFVGVAPEILRETILLASEKHLST